MNLRKTRFIFTCVVAVIFVFENLGVFSAVLSTASAAQAVTLPSGSKIVVETVGKIYFAKDESWALVLRYRTHIGLADVSKLRNEVIEIWREFFRQMAEKSGLSGAAIVATDKPKPAFGIGKRNTFGFVFLKDEDDKWRIRNPDQIIE